VHPPEERGVAALSGARGIFVSAHRMVDDRRDRHIARRARLVMGDGDHRDVLANRSVHVAKIALEGTVTGGDDRHIRQRPGVEGTGERVVVHDVGTEPAHRSIGMDDVTQLGGASPTSDPDRIGEHRLGRHRAGAVAGGEQQHVVPRVLQSPGQGVEDSFGAAIGGWRYGDPRRGNDADAHAQAFQGGFRSR
jgi:hypothetical protein